MLKSSVDQALQTSDLVLLGEHGDVVLEGVGDPKALVADIGDSLMDEPVVVLGESLVQAVVEVLVVGENDVTANIVQLEKKSSNCQHNDSNARFYGDGERERTYESFRSDISSGKTTSLVGRVDNQP